MTWGQEILRAFLLALGCFEIVTNLTYLTLAGGINKARKQHGELPKGLPDKNIRIKATCMLIAGLALFAVALSSYILHTYTGLAIRIVLVLFSFYGITEALYYRYWKTFGFSIVTIIVMIVSFLL